jgi:hypothetical protein
MMPGGDVEKERGRFKEFAQQHPALNFAGNVVGGMGNPLYNKLPGGPVAAGALGGGLAGLGEGEGLSDRLWSAGAGVAGGGIGGLLLGKYLPMAARGVKNLLAGPNPEKSGYNLLNTALQRDRTNLDDVSKRMSDTSAPLMVADAGRNTQRLARTVTTQPGEGSGDLAGRLVGRQADQPARVSNLIRSTVDPKNANTEIDALVAAREAATKPAYQKAYAQGPVYDDHIAQLMENPNVKKGLRKGIDIERNLADAQNRKIDWSDYAVTGFDSSGAPIVGKVPNMRVLDTAKRGLDDMLEEYRNKITGKLELDNEGRSINQVRKSLLERMDDINPDYKVARRAYAGPTESKNAINAGRQFMKGDVEDVDKLFSSLTPHDKEFFVTGIAYELRNMARGGTSDTVDATRKILQGKTRDRLRRYLGPEQYDELERELRNEANTTRTMRMATTGSPTGPILAEQADAADQEHAAVGALVDAAALGVRPAVANAARRLMRRGGGMSEATADWLGPKLQASSPAELSLLRDDLNKFLSKRQGRRNLGKALTGGVATGSYNLLTGE